MSSPRNPTMSLAVLPNDHARKKLFVKTVETRTFLHARERKQMHFVSPKLQVALTTTRGKISRVWGQQAQREHGGNWNKRKNPFEAWRRNNKSWIRACVKSKEWISELTFFFHHKKVQVELHNETETRHSTQRRYEKWEKWRWENFSADFWWINMKFNFFSSTCELSSLPCTHDNSSRSAGCSGFNHFVVCCCFLTSTPVRNRLNLLTLIMLHFMMLKCNYFLDVEWKHKQFLN